MQWIARAGGAALALAVVAAGAPAARADTPDQIYQKLQGLQSFFNPPTSPPAIIVGTLDLKTGKWSGMEGVVTNAQIEDYEDLRGEKDARGKPVHPTGPKPTVRNQTVYVYGDAPNTATFNCHNRMGASVKVTVNGQPTTRSADSLTIPLGKAAHVDWKLESGQQGAQGSFDVKKIPLMGLGLSTIPIVPLAVIYDVPQDQSKQNVMTYSQSNTSGTTVAVAFTYDSSTSTPGEVPGGYGTLMTVKSVLGAVGPIAGAVGEKVGTAYPVVGAVLQAAGKAMDFIAGALGNAAATNTDQQTSATQTTKGVTYTTGATNVLNQHLGPGDGDKIVFIKGARLVTVMQGGKLTTAKLFDAGIQPLTVHFLKERLATLQTPSQIDSQTGLTKEVIQDLLGLDPQAMGGPNATLDPKRYKSMGTYGVNGGQDTYSFSCTVTQEDLTANTKTTVHAENYTPGTFSFLGWGVTEDKSTKVSVANMVTTATTAGQTKTVSATFNAGPDEYYVVEGFYDNVFGTVLFRRVDGNDAVSGTATDSSGNPQPRKLVTITQGGKTFATRTDAKGRYLFRMGNLQPAMAKIRIDNTEHDLDLRTFNPRGGKPIQHDLKIGR